jgi:S1-C subfamily serine protease
MQIFIQHDTGSKANQVEPFQYDNVEEITLGRDPGCQVAYDPQRDDAVSRRHATIKIAKGDRPTFSIVDQNSANGTMVNGTRIAGEQELMPGDKVQLGKSGPIFTFELQPRPAHLMARTRVVGDRTIHATRIDPAFDEVPPPMPDTAGSVPPPAPPPTAVRSGVGRETVQRMLSEERVETGKKWMIALAAVIAFTVIIGGGLYYRMVSDNKRVAAEIEQKNRDVQAEADRKIDDQRRRLEADAKRREDEIKRTIGVQAPEILQKYGDATVVVEMQWRLFDRNTGKALYHKMALSGGRKIPAYIDLGDRKVVRWLTTEAGIDNTNQPVGAKGSGTGFVVDSQGYILTNKHVAAGWLINYNAYAKYEQNAQIAVFTLQTERSKKLPDFKEYNIALSQFNELTRWTPDDGGLIFAEDQPVRVAGNQSCACQGRNEFLQVRFPGSRDAIEARLVRPSNDADVALIKIDSREELKTVPLAGDNSVIKGGSVTVLGYPSTSVQNYAIHRTIENGEVRNRQTSLVPEPTVTTGSISALSVAAEQHGDVTVVGPMGELYQLTAATSEGNSGGPVFDSTGKVIAIFTYGTNRETLTLAVPIHFGHSLLPVQRKN